MCVRSVVDADDRRGIAKGRVGESFAPRYEQATLDLECAGIGSIGLPSGDVLSAVLQNAHACTVGTGYAASAPAGSLHGDSSNLVSSVAEYRGAGGFTDCAPLQPETDQKYLYTDLGIGVRWERHPHELGYWP